MEDNAIFLRRSLETENAKSEQKGMNGEVQLTRCFRHSIHRMHE